MTSSSRRDDSPKWLWLGLGSTTTLFGTIACLSSGVVYGVNRSKIRLSSEASSVAFRALGYSTVIVSISGAITATFVARTLNVKSLSEFRQRLESMMPRDNISERALQSYTVDHIERISAWIQPMRSKLSNYFANTDIMKKVREKYQSDAYIMSDVDKEVLNKIASLECSSK